MDKRTDKNKQKNINETQKDKNTKKLFVAMIIIIAAAAAAVGLYLGLVAFAPGREPETSAVIVSQAEPTIERETLAETEAVVVPEGMTFLPEMKELFKRNHDVTGWITIEGTVIDYPVMYTPDDGEYYLRRNFEGEHETAGCIFIDKNSTVNPRSTNLLFHGHNMRDGSMFHVLMDYKNEDFYKTHPKIKYKTLYEQQEYQIISVFLSKVYKKSETDVFKYYKFVNANTQEEFDYFINNIQALALYDTGMSAEFGDELITLSTCEYSQKNGRIVVVAKKIK